MTATMPEEKRRLLPARLSRPARVPRPARPAGTARAAPPPAQGAPAVLSTCFAMVALICLWTAAQLLVLGGLAHERTQDLLYREFRTQLAGATAPIGPVVPVGDPVAVLTVPRLGLQGVVVEGTASGDTLAGPGHLRNTVLPGQEGTSVLMGRAATYGGPFGDLAALSPGDRFTVVVAQGTVRFTVIGVRHAGDPLPAPREPGRARLTLVTAEGAGRLSALTPDTALFVDAETKKALAAPPGLPAVVPDSELTMATDPAAIPLLTLYLALLLALTLGVVAARQRWSAALVWVVAAPVALALSWQTTDVVMRLLPNLI